VGTKKDSPVSTNSAYAAPTPQVFYIHDDLSDDVRHTHGEHSRACQLAQELLTLVRRDAQRVIVLQLEDQITRLVAQGSHPPFAVTVGIGQAGERVARQLHQRTGWFPVMRRVDVTREEDGQGGYNLVSTRAQSLAAQLQGVETCASLAVVDDTVFSGLTMGTVLRALPAVVLAHTHAFCLRGVAESLSSIRLLCPISIGFAAPGRLIDEVSFINATGLVRRISIRRVGQPSLAFFDRPEWMHAWFPGYADEVIAVCRRLHALLEPLR
jgi:hypothetical protein